MWTRRAFGFLGLLLMVAGCTPIVNESKPVVSALPPPVAAPDTSEPSTKVALLLPLSGPQQKLGQALLDAAQLAVYDLGDASFGLMPLDTSDSAEAAANAALTAMNGGSKLLIGPIFTPAVAAAKPLARARNVPMLALSNNATLADPNTHILGYSPAQQVARVLTYAAARNSKRIAALVPTTAYGQLVEEVLLTESQRLGLTLVHLERYSSRGDATLSITNLKNALAAKGGADALLIPETGAPLRQLTDALTIAGLTQPGLRYLGTALWEEIPSGSNPALQGGWYASAATEQRRAFISRFTTTYGYAPPAVASLAYDATALAIVLTKEGNGFNLPRLTNDNGFSGVDGVFRLRPNGQSERAMAVLEVGATGPTILEAAPTSF